MNKSAITRLMADVKNARALEDCGIFIHQTEDNFTKIHAIIIGPENTPYYGGFFHFILKFPDGYPFEPPSCKIMTTGGGRVRFNPNLYSNGKVCLSILGTWSGPPWTPAMTLSVVLLSVQSLMGERPMENEPGYETRVTTQEHIKYNAIISHETIRVAYVEQILAVNRGTSGIPEELRDVIRNNAMKFADHHRKICDDNISVTGRMTDSFGEARGSYAYKAMLDKINELTGSTTTTTSNNVAAAAAAATATQAGESLVAEKLGLPRPPTAATHISGATADAIDTVVSGVKANDSNSTVGRCSAAATGGGGASVSSSSSSLSQPPMPPAPTEGTDMDRSESLELKKRELQEELKCAVCFDLLATPAAFECGHVYCFKCATICLHNDSKCPTCRKACKKSELHRVFIDGIVAREATSLFAIPGSKVEDVIEYKEWLARVTEGVELASGKEWRPPAKPAAARSYQHHYGDEDEDEDDYSDDGMYPPDGPYGGSSNSSSSNLFGGGYYGGSGAGHKLGGGSRATDGDAVVGAHTQPLSKEEARELRLKTLEAATTAAAAKKQPEAALCWQIDALATATTTASGSSSVAPAAASTRIDEEVAVKRAKMSEKWASIDTSTISASTASSSAGRTSYVTAKKAASSSSSSAAATGAVSAESGPPMTEQQRRVAQLTREKKAAQAERERLRFEINRDKAERAKNNGVLSSSYEKDLVSRTHIDNVTLPVVHSKTAGVRDSSSSDSASDHVSKHSRQETAHILSSRVNMTSDSSSSSARSSSSDNKSAAQESSSRIEEQRSHMPENNSTSGGDSGYWEAVENLMNLGFHEAECLEALSAAAGNPDLAYEFLVSGSKTSDSINAPATIVRSDAADDLAASAAAARVNTTAAATTVPALKLSSAIPASAARTTTTTTTNASPAKSPVPPPTAESPPVSSVAATTAAAASTTVPPSIIDIDTTAVMLKVNEAVDQIIQSCVARPEQSRAALCTLVTMFETIVKNPTEEKYRSFKLQSKVFKETLYMTGVQLLLASIGFVKRKDESVSPAVWRMKLENGYDETLLGEVVSLISKRAGLR